jgi:hypothetical protein
MNESGCSDGSRAFSCKYRCERRRRSRCLLCPRLEVRPLKLRVEGARERSARRIYRLRKTLKKKSSSAHSIRRKLASVNLRCRTSSSTGCANDPTLQHLLLRCSSRSSHMVDLCRKGSSNVASVLKSQTTGIFHQQEKLHQENYRRLR